ncbi:MAG: hypothetical protein ACHQE6_00410 [Solirubrobacterales bacterium]
MTDLDAAWADVISGLDSKPESIAALVRTLDRLDALDAIKQQVLADAAAELKADPIASPATVTAWLHRQLSDADGECRSRHLRDAASRDGIGWRTVERAKTKAGVVAFKRDRVSWWRLTLSPPSPPKQSESPCILAER